MADALLQLRDAVVKQDMTLLPTSGDISAHGLGFITDTLEEILTSGQPIREAFLKCSWLIEQIFPAITPCIGFDQHSFYHNHDVYEHMLYVTDYCKDASFLVKLAALLHDIGKPAACVVGEDGWNHYHGHPDISYSMCCKLLPCSLALDDAQLSHVLTLIRLHDARVQPTEESINNMLQQYSIRLISDWFILKQADIADHINMTVGRTCTDIDACKKLFNELKYNYPLGRWPNTFVYKY